MFILIEGIVLFEWVSHMGFVTHTALLGIVVIILGFAWLQAEFG